MMSSFEIDLNWCDPLLLSRAYVPQLRKMNIRPPGIVGMSELENEDKWMPMDCSLDELYVLYI